MAKRAVRKSHCLHAKSRKYPLDFSAVLCSCDRRAVILVFRGGRSNQVDELAEDADSQYLQVMTGSEIRYSRRLAVATPKIIRQHVGGHGTPRPRIVDHDGIENRFVGKASVVWYRFGESRSSFRERTDASGCNNRTTVARKSAAVQPLNIWCPPLL